MVLYRSNMKIYFAGSIRGGRNDQKVYLQIIEELGNYGTVVMEHVGDQKLTEYGEVGPSSQNIYERNMKWMQQADVLVAEVTQPSLGVGFEIAKAEDRGIPILCLYKPSTGKRLSGLIGGSSKFTVRDYKNFDGAKLLIKEFFTHLS